MVFPCQSRGSQSLKIGEIKKQQQQQLLRASSVLLCSRCISQYITAAARAHRLRSFSWYVNLHARRDQNKATLSRSIDLLEKGRDRVEKELQRARTEAPLTASLFLSLYMYISPRSPTLATEKL